MDTTELQARVQQLTHLLPSQQEWLERLLFQLTFNDSDQFYVVGTEGSGKSTLAMAIAELCSDHFNIALLSSNINEIQASDQLMQQWFGKPAQADVQLNKQISAELSQLPLLLIVDDAERYSHSFTEQLIALPCQQFYFSTQGSGAAGLTLTLNRITERDAEQLLQHESLNSIELTERLANAAGNIRLLLQPSARPRAAVVGSIASLPKINKVVYGTAALALIGLLLYGFWPEQKKSSPPSAPTVTQQRENLIEQPMADQTVVEPPVLTLPETTIDNQNVVEEPSVQATDAIVSEPEIVVVKPTDEDTSSDVAVNASDDVTRIDNNAELTANDDTVIAPQYLHDETQLLSLPKQLVAVQLAVLSSEAALQRFKRIYPQLATLSYQRNWQGKMQLVLLLAPFDDAQSAKAQMKQLPEALRATGPFVKALQAVQAEVRSRPLSQLNSSPE